MTRPTAAHAPFLTRHIGDYAALRDPNSPILSSLGIDNLEQLADAVIPPGLPKLPPAPPTTPSVDTGGLSEAEVVAQLRALAALNDPHIEMIGQGYHPSYTPAVIARDVLNNPAWITAYTPYQAEISQGRLEAQLLFQTLISDLTGLPVACASLLDEPTAVAEAALLMVRSARKGADRPLVLDAGLHPQCLQVVTARLDALGIAWVKATTPEISNNQIPTLSPSEPLLGAVLAAATTRGEIVDLTAAISCIHARGGLAAVDVDPLALTVIKEPGAMDADIAVGSAQRFGIPLFFGGPHPGFMAVKASLQRQLPGRVVGISVDAQENPAYRLALQTREQHIRREKATSNICTAQALLAVVAAFYAVYHGGKGLRAIAMHTHAQAVRIASGLTQSGVNVENQHFFDTLSVCVPAGARALVQSACARGYNFRLLDADHVGVSTNETTTAADVAAVIEIFTGKASTELEFPPASTLNDLNLPTTLTRQSNFLTHPTFNRYHSEVAFTRYLRRLADRDLALDRTMIPLGSCTLKLNAAVQSALWLEPRWAGIHPYAPASQTRGWQRLLTQISTRLAHLTGYDRISLQPASGAQGELTGLLAIKNYLRAQGQECRDLVLIPASAHGTNAASAAGAGLEVKVVATASNGSIDLDNLRQLLATYGQRVAAIMLTYPSTHGVFEPQVSEVTKLVHDAGGQVYIDGANLNALTGLLRPGDLGGDCSHLNLHKTFAIPHGGGGPGVGPVAVKAHLAPYLPAGAEGSALPETGDPDAGFSGSPIMGARFGSAGIIPLAWSYLCLLSDSDLRTVSLAAIANANYVSRQLADYFPTLYTHNGFVAHECILDLRQLTKISQVSAEDVAKRLIDYGIHAPTLSFPVSGTLMVEPTESEPLCELDRFIAAMRSIRAEIDAVVSGSIPVEDCALRNSPHTLAQLLADTWDHPYTRTQAAFPLPGMQQDKYFPPVARIDNAWGDRHLMCTCPPIDAFESEHQL